MRFWFKILFTSFTFFILTSTISLAQIVNYDIRKLRKEWGYWDFFKANTARFSMYMGRTQKRTMLFMNLARQDGNKFTELVVKPYIEKYPQKNDLYVQLGNQEFDMLYPSFRLWLAAVPHAFISGITGSTGHQGIDARMLLTLNLNSTGENCSYGHFTGLDVTLQLLNSSGHRANILNIDYSRAAVSKFPHIVYGWNSVTCFSGPKFCDMTIRGHNDIKHMQLTLGIMTDFNYPVIDLNIGMRYNKNVSSARWALGTEIIINKDKSVFGPKVSFVNEFYYFGFGGSLISFLQTDNTHLILRPEISFRFPYSIKRSIAYTVYEYLDLEESKASIGISYSYNLNLNRGQESVLNEHLISVTYSRNFLFKRAKRNY